MTSEPFFALATLLFSIGLIGIVSRRNLFVVYMSIELMLSSVNLILALFSRLDTSMHGSVIALMVAVIAAEAALFLAIIVHLYRQRRSIDSDVYSSLAQRDLS